jgi:hypothetical protein
VEYYVRACGEWLIPIVVTGVASIAAALAVAVRGRGATVGPALVLSVLATPLVGLLATLLGLIESFQIIEQTGVAPDAAQLLAGCGLASAPVALALMFAIPAALIGLSGATFRALRAPTNAGMH